MPSNTIKIKSKCYNIKALQNVTDIGCTLKKYQIYFPGKEKPSNFDLNTIKK